MAVKPLCYQCGRRPARTLPKLPAAFARAVGFCSLRCAAVAGLEPVVHGTLAWCDRCECWHGLVMRGLCESGEGNRP